ncbi:MAG TPA: ABC transporter ATP-binding protein [bacterium]|nr:ABC transporter ATP-binding protein [bacterium]
MAPAISTRQLSVTFPGRGRRPAVSALLPLDLDVDGGRIVAVLGPNGSGKTTLLRVLAGLQRATSGTATLLGQRPDSRALRRRVAFQSEAELPLQTLSAPEFLAFVGAELDLPNAESDRRAAALLDRLELTHARRRRVRTFSTGMKKRLALAAALLSDPEVLLLDEPTAGLDPFGTQAVMTILRERAAGGTAILMASHHLLEVEEISDEVLLLHGGAVRARGPLAELLATDERALVVRGLDADAMVALADDARRRGGEVVRVERPRDHLFALFRRLGRAPEGDREADR